MVAGGAGHYFLAGSLLRSKVPQEGGKGEDVERGDRAYHEITRKLLGAPRLAFRFSKDNFMIRDF